MKIYFAGSVSGKKYFGENYSAIITTLQKMGHDVYCTHFLKANATSIENQTENESIIAQEGLLKEKIISDLMVVETSYRSFGVGQEIANAARLNKPVLALYTKGHKPHILRNESGERLLIVEYNLGNLEEILKGNIDYFRINESKRFTLLLPSDQINYLDRVLREKGVPRSEYIRELIKEDMGRNLKGNSKINSGKLTKLGGKLG